MQAPFLPYYVPQSYNLAPARSPVRLDKVSSSAQSSVFHDSVFTLSAVNGGPDSGKWNSTNPAAPHPSMPSAVTAIKMEDKLSGTVVPLPAVAVHIGSSAAPPGRVDAFSQYEGPTNLPAAAQDFWPTYGAVALTSPAPAVVSSTKMAVDMGAITDAYASEWALQELAAAFRLHAGSQLQEEHITPPTSEPLVTALRASPGSGSVSMVTELVEHTLTQLVRSGQARRAPLAPSRYS